MDDEVFSGFARDILVRKLCMKIVKVTGLMHALKDKLVHMELVFLI